MRRAFHRLADKLEIVDRPVTEIYRLPSAFDVLSGRIYLCHSKAKIYQVILFVKYFVIQSINNFDKKDGP